VDPPSRAVTACSRFWAIRRPCAGHSRSRPSRTSRPPPGATSLTGGECDAPSRRSRFPPGWTFPEWLSWSTSGAPEPPRIAGKNGSGSAKRATAEVVYPGLLPAHGTGLTPAGCRLGPGTLEDREPAPLRSVTWSSTSHHQLRTANGPEIMAALRNLATWPHPTLSRPQCLYRLNHQIPVTTTKTAIKLLVQPTT